MISGWSRSLNFIPPNLRDMLGSGLSPSMIMIEEFVVESISIILIEINPIVIWWNIALFVNDSWSNLSNMHVNHQTVVGINFEQFVFG